MVSDEVSILILLRVDALVLALVLHARILTGGVKCEQFSCLGLLEERA